jgi:predicted dehydrogenase
MRFALLGDHPDGLQLARAVAESGRHELLLYCGSAIGLEQLRHHGLTPQVVADIEEALADVRLDAVIVAGTLAERSLQLRRAVQSEHHVLCVHPSDASSHIACETSLIQADTNRVLLPILPMTLHPAMAQLALLMRASPPRMIEMELWSTEEALLEAAGAAPKPGLPGWDVLRYLGGEIGEVFAHTPQTELLPGLPLLVSGKFVNGMVFQATCLPNQSESRWRISLVQTTGRASLWFRSGWPGPAELSWVDETGASRSENWPDFNPFAAILDRFDQAVDLCALRRPTPGQPSEESLTKTPPALGWHDELRAVELDEAARRSAHYGRSSIVDLQEATEEATFKGTMTLVGCSLIWLAVIVLILAVWVPWLAWFILPVLAIFLGLQTLRWVLPKKDAARQHASGK